MKNNNSKLLLWGFIVLVILNVILLAYVFVGASGGGPRLSPTGCDGTIVNVFGMNICTTGSGVHPTEVQFVGSKIRQINNGYLDILSKEAKGVRIAGLDSSNNMVPTNVEVNGTISTSGVFNDGINNLRTGSTMTKTSIYTADQKLDNTRSRMVNIEPIGISMYEYRTGMANNPYSVLLPSGLIFRNYNDIEPITTYGKNGICFTRTINNLPTKFLCAPDNNGGNWACERKDTC